MAYYSLKYVVLFENEVRRGENYRCYQIWWRLGYPFDAKKPTDNRVLSGEYKNWRKKKHKEEAL